MVNVHLKHGKHVDAMKAMENWCLLCRQHRERKVEAEALQALGEVYQKVIQSDETELAELSPHVLQKALTASKELVNLQRSLGDVAGQVSGLLQLAGLHQLNQAGESALQAAEESVQLAKELGQAETGAALVTLAEVHIFLENGGEARQSAE